MLAKLVSYGGERPPIAQVSSDVALSPSHEQIRAYIASEIHTSSTIRTSLRLLVASFSQIQ